MFINSIKLRNFRNFTEQTFKFTSNAILIAGENGSGKTTLLEAIYFFCFLKSFRTSIATDLLKFGEKQSFLSLDFEDKLGTNNRLGVGISTEGYKTIKLNNKNIRTYKDIISNFKVINLDANDLFLIQGYPQNRRLFLTQSIVLLDAKKIALYREFKRLLQHRNKLLENGNFSNLENLTQYSELYIWTRKLWEQAVAIQNIHISFLEDLEKAIISLLKENISDSEIPQITLKYSPKKNVNFEKFEDFWTFLDKNSTLKNEIYLKRTLFGPHLDDINIVFKTEKAKSFASRGQQKFIVFLIKMGVNELLKQKGEVPIILLDDFLTDFDNHHLGICLKILNNQKNQFFITTPHKHLNFPSISNFQKIELKT